MKPEESVRPSIVLCGAQKVRKALLRQAGEFAVGAPKLQRAEAAISGRHTSEEVGGLHRRITEALQDERHDMSFDFSLSAECFGPFSAVSTKILAMKYFSETLDEIGTINSNRNIKILLFRELLKITTYERNIRRIFMKFHLDINEHTRKN